MAIFWWWPPNEGIKFSDIKIMIRDQYLALSRKRYKTEPQFTMESEYETIPKLLNDNISNDLEWLKQNIQWHEASRGLSATAELLDTFVIHWIYFKCITLNSGTNSTTENMTRQWHLHHIRVAWNNPALTIMLHLCNEFFHSLNILFFRWMHHDYCWTQDAQYTADLAEQIQFLTQTIGRHHCTVIQTHYY